MIRLISRTEENKAFPSEEGGNAPANSGKIVLRAKTEQTAATPSVAAPSAGEQAQNARYAAEQSAAKYTQATQQPKTQSNGYVSMADLNRATNGSGTRTQEAGAKALQDWYAARTSGTVQKPAGTRYGFGAEMTTTPQAKPLDLAEEGFGYVVRQNEADRQAATAQEKRAALEAREQDLIQQVAEEHAKMNRIGRDSVSYTTDPRELNRLLDELNTVRDELDTNYRGHQTVGQRIANTVTGLGKTYAGSMAGVDEWMSNVEEAYQGARERSGNTRNYKDDGGRVLGAEPTAESARRQAEESRAIGQRLNESGQADIAKAQEGLGKTGRLLVNAGVALGQMGLDVGIGALTGGGAMLPMMARSFGGGVQQAREKGYNVLQQTSMGLANAATEYLTEKLFGGNPAYDTDIGLVNKLVAKVAGNGKLVAALSSMPAEIVSEGLEEVASDILEPIAEYVISGGNWTGYDIDQMIEDGVIGMIMGGFGQGGQYVTDMASGATKQGKTLREMGPDVVRSVADEGLASGKDTDSYKMARKLDWKLNNGQRISDGELGRAYRANVRAIEAEQNAAAEPKTVQQETPALYLPRVGGAGDAFLDSYAATLGGTGTNAARAGDLTSTANRGAEARKNASDEAALELNYPEVNENGLAALSPREVENLSSGKRNKVVSTFSDAVSFIRNALANLQSSDRAYMGKITEATAAKVLTETGVDVSGYNAILPSDNVRHIMKKHGDAKSEAKRGQIAVTPEDIALIPEVLTAPDAVMLSHETDSRGRPVLVFEKQIGDNFVTIQAVADGTHSLQTDTLYKQKRKNPQGTEYYNAGNTTDPAHNVRNVPPQGSFISDSTIAQPSNAVKSENANSTGIGAAEDVRQLPGPEQNAATMTEAAMDELGLRRSEEPRYLPTAEEIENGQNAYGRSFNELVDDVRPLPTAEAEDIPMSSAEYARRQKAEAAAPADEVRPLPAPGMEETGAKEPTGGKQRTNKPARAKKQLRHELLSTFSIPDGAKATLGEKINTIADKIFAEGKITEEARRELIDTLFDAGVATLDAPSEYQELRAALKGRRIFVNESIRGDLGDDWNSLRRQALANGFYLVTDRTKGPGVDVVADELEDRVGRGMIDPEADGATQLRQMIKAAELGKGDVISLAEEARLMEQEYGPGYVEDQIDNLERQFDDAMRRFAEKARLEVDIKNWADERIEREKQAWRDAFAKRDEARKQREAAAQTLRNLKRLRRRIGMNDTRLAEAMERLSPQEQQLAQEALGNLSTDAKRLTERARAKMEENAELYERMVANDPNYIPDKKTLALLERMDQTYLADMTSEELMDVHRALQALEKHLSDLNKEIGEKRGEEFGVLYKFATGEIRDSKGREARTGVRARLDKLMDSQLTPMNFLEMLGGWKKGTWYNSVAQQLEEGERARKAFVVEANDMMKEFREKYADWIAKSDGQGKGATWYDIEVPQLLEYDQGHKPLFGETVTVHLTPAMRVELARGIRNNDNLRHAEGGVTFPNKELYSKGERAEAYERGTTVKLAPETMKKLFAYENLTAEEKALYDLMDDFFDGKAKQAINETSQMMDGIDRAMSNHYSKIYTNKNYRATDSTKIDESIGGMGSLQKRVFSKNPMLAMSVWEAFDDTVDTVSKYHGLAIPTRNTQMLFNWQQGGDSLKDTIAQKWGGDAVKYVEKLLGDLQNRSAQDKSTIDALTGKLLNNYVTATFGANPGIVLKQFSSFPSAAAVLGVSNAPTPAQIAKTDANLIARYTPELEYRSLGYATPELAELKNNPNWTQRNKVTRFLFGGAIQGMDRFTVKAMWPWAENYVKTNFKDLEPGTDAFYRKTAEIFNEAVTLTQPMYDVMHRARIMQGGSDLTRAFTMFKTVPLQQQNMLRKAVGEAQNATGSAKTDARQNLARTVGSIVAANLLFELIEFGNQAWKNAAKNYRDDDDELSVESVGEGITENALKDMVGMFIGGDELTDMLDIIGGKKNSYFAGLEAPGLSQLQNVISSIETTGKTMRQVAGDAKNIIRNGGSLGAYVRQNGSELLGDVKDLAEDMSVYFAGVPVTNIEKYLLGTLRVISPKLEQEYKALWEATTKRDLSGLSGEALQVRVDDLIDGRVQSVSAEAKQELARLYESTGAEIIPSDVPTSLTVDGEKQTLTAAQEQRYRTAYTDTIGDSLDKLLTSEEYGRLDDDARAAAITGLYNYAKDEAKCAVTGAEKESATVKAETAADMGLAPEKYFALKAGIAESTDGLEDDAKLTAKLETLDAAGLKPAEKGAAYYSFVANEKEKALIDDAAPLSVGELCDTLTAIRRGGMQEGTEKSVAQRVAILDAALPSATKQDVYRATISDSEKRNAAIDGFLGAGGDFDEYLTFEIDTAGLSSDKDANGKDIKGRTKRDKVLAVIDGYQITRAQKDALYFAAGYAESTIEKAPWRS